MRSPWVYTYNDRSEISGITYPTGTQVTVQRYDNGEVSGILIDGQTATQNLSYLPFGPEEDFVFGNNLLTMDRSYVADYFRVKRINAQVLDYQYEYYADGSVKSIDGITEPAISAGRTEYVTVNGNNRLDYVTRPDSSVRNYIHDSSGRITSDGVYTYSYNPLGKLIKVEQDAATVAEYAYDPFGRRVKKTVSGTTTHFHYDLQGRLIAETVGDGTPLRDYVYQNGNLVAIKLHGTQAGVYYVISDHLGTPQQIVDATGTVVWKAAFLPFGKAQILTETISNNIRFPGQYFDAETGLHYNWNRYYDPDTGRYLTPDPIGLDGGMNLFAYVAGDPVNWVDPMGLSPVGWIVRLTKAGMRKLSPVQDVALARRARRQGQNVLARDRQTARQIERGANGGRDTLRHSGHDLGNGKTGKPHYQTNGKYGHTFWQAALGFGLSLLDPFDAISGELDGNDMLCSDGTAPPCNDPCQN